MFGLMPQRGAFLNPTPVIVANASFMTAAISVSPLFDSEIDIDEPEAALVDSIHHQSVQERW